MSAPQRTPALQRLPLWCGHPACNSRRGFTFIEVLAAMLFMAILIPAAMEGLLIANRAGVVAERKRVAAQLADRLLTEALATEEWRQGDQEGACGDEWPDYRWTLTTNAWEEDTMRAVTVTVFFTAQGQEYHVALTTLAEETTQTAGTTQPGTTQPGTTQPGTTQQ